MVQNLLDQLPEDDNDTLITVKQDSLPASPSSRPSTPAGFTKYDPSVTYILEFCTMLATRDEETIASMGKLVFDTLQGILRDSKQYHAITISRATFYALKILKSSYVGDDQPLQISTVANVT